jgi:hypothetical protein
MNTRDALGKLLDSLPPDFPNRAYYDEICAKEQQMKYDDETPPPAFRENMTAVHAKLAGAASVIGLQHISDTAANALRKAVTQLEHMRVFASSGQKIHPTGLELFDADVDFIKRSLVAIEQYRADRGGFVPVMGADQLREIHSALDDALGDSDVSHIEDDDELRSEHPTQWAAQKLAELIATLPRS